MWHVSFSRWAKVDGLNYDAECSVPEVGTREAEAYLPEGVTFATAFETMRAVRGILTQVKPDEEGVYPIFGVVEINIPNAVQYVPPPKPQVPVVPVSWWDKVLRFLTRSRSK